MIKEEHMKSYDDGCIMKDYKDYDEVVEKIEKTTVETVDVFKEDDIKIQKDEFVNEQSYKGTSNTKEGPSTTDYAESTTKVDETSSKSRKKSPIKMILSILVIIGIFSFIANNEDIKNQITDILNLPIENSEDYLLANSNRRYLKEEDLIEYSKEELGFIRNEIFARHGYIFGKNKYKSYFEAQQWYTPNPDFKGNSEELNKYEVHNIKLILRLEKR